MGIAEQINTALTGATVRSIPAIDPRILRTIESVDDGTVRKVSGPAPRTPWRGAARPPTGRARLLINRAEADNTRQVLREVVLEHQQGMYRVFHVLTGNLIHSHEFRLEAIRRAERDNFVFVHMAPAA